MSVSEKVLDAIQLLTNASVKKAQYDKTIQAQIISCEDSTIGKYRCRYQDSVFYAYTNNLDISYNKGAMVYVLVPGNDMNKEKTILGTTEKLGINYISQASSEQRYEKIGINCINSDNLFYLDTNNKNYRYAIYQYGRQNNDIDIDNESLSQYLKQSSHIIIGAFFKTNITPIKQQGGHYGITYNLKFRGNTSTTEITHSYTIDENQMVDNPYRLSYGKRQFQVFEIDGSNFIRVESIQIFNSDFPQAKGTNTNSLLNSGDITISKLELLGSVERSENEINGISISFYTPRGTFFNESSEAGDYKTITAQVRFKGNLIPSSDNISFYWGSENVGISSGNQYYNRFLGRGWKCLNDFNKVIPKEGEESVIEWVPGKDTITLQLSQATAKNNKFKVAVLYNGSLVSKEINIQNLGLNVPELTIESSDGTQFYYNVGCPTLTCKVNGVEQKNYFYFWGYQDNNGNSEVLETTDDLNTRYTVAVTALEKLKDQIATGKKFANAAAEELDKAENAVAQYKYKQRVQGNKIYNVQINSITNFIIYKCTVYNDQNVFLGTASITLTNSLDGEAPYTLVINNGSVAYQYNENGLSPTSKDNLVPQTIKALSFTIYDNYGNPIDEEIASSLENKWTIPIKNTLLVDSEQNGEIFFIDADQTYKTYNNLTNFVYDISHTYNINNQINQIKLTVNYKGMLLFASTNFVFTKQGEPGTNGTRYIVKLVPNTLMSNPPSYPVILYDKKGKAFYLNYGLGSPAEETELQSGGIWLKAQLYLDGEKIWQGNSFPSSPGSKNSINWSILQNKYNNSVFDDSLIILDNAETGVFSVNSDPTDEFIKKLSSPQANIIKCTITYQGKNYYGTMPIIFAYTYDKEQYNISFKEQTGFRYVLYNTEGTSPQYDSSIPFEFTCLEKINGIWENISTIQDQDFDKKITYTFSALEGIKVYNKEKREYEIQPSSFLEVLDSDTYKKDLTINQIKCRPAKFYNGQCVNIALSCTFKQGKDGVIIGKILVPIHYLLNRYSFPHLNEWDGNSIQISEDGGYILSPQMGAGIKDSDNRFTGVLMGEVKTPGKTSSDIGLLGYGNGKRTFFLNSEDGSTFLGNGKGQIILDPTSEKAMIYSYNFWEKYDTNTGLPSYDKSNENEEGLLIDLSTPSIRYGNGNFSVDENGNLIAKGKGSIIAGWKIQSDELKSSDNSISLAAQTKDAQGKITSSGKIYSNEHNTLISTSAGFYLSKDGLSIGSLFKVDKNGVVRIGNGAVDEKNKNHWVINGSTYKDNNNNTITNSYIAYGESTDITKFIPAGQANNDNAKVYLGTDGLSIGNKFSVDNKGNLIAYTGNIGGWEITNKGLQYQDSSKTEKIIIGSDGSITGGTKDTSKWTIKADGSAVFNNIKVPGLTQIGGWQVRGNTLQSKNGTIILDANAGTIYNRDKKWTISGNGSISLASGGSFSVGGGTLSAGGSSFAGNNTVLPALSTFVGDQSLSGYVQTISAGVVNAGVVNIGQQLTIGGRATQWTVATVQTNYGADNYGNPSYWTTSQLGKSWSTSINGTQVLTIYAKPNLQQRTVYLLTN